LFESRDGIDRSGLDLDALRMYLRWRGVSLAALRADPETHRDPDSVGATYDPTDGAVGTDGGQRPDDRTGDTDTDTGADADADADSTDAGHGPGSDADPVTEPAETASGAAVEDPWAAGTFLASIRTDAYGTRPKTLREGLEVLVDRDAVWVSPGIPFIVPTFLGLLLALTYGDLLVGLLVFLGGG
jgi:preflagellin peptidase FlaK